MRTFAVLALALGLMGAAVAAPSAKTAAKAAAGHKAACCSAGEANHGIYVACCEVGNSAFFTSKSCGACAKHRAEAAKAAHKSSAEHAHGNGYVSCCEEGNRSFFTQGCTSCGSKAACCAKDGKSAKKK